MLCLKTTAFGLDLCRRFFASAPGSAPGSKNRIKLLQALRLACDLFIITIFLPRCLSNPNTALTRGVSSAILIKRGGKIWEQYRIFLRYFKSGAFAPVAPVRRKIKRSLFDNNRSWNTPRRTLAGRQTLGNDDNNNEIPYKDTTG